MNDLDRDFIKAQKNLLNKMIAVTVAVIVGEIVLLGGVVAIICCVLRWYGVI